METKSSEGRVINLLNLFFDLLKKYRSLFLLLVIGIILGSLYSGVQMVKAKNAGEKEISTEELNMEKIRQYADYQTLFDSLCDYSDKSYYINMNLSETYDGTADFLIDGTGQNPYASGSSFVSFLNGEDVKEQLLQASGSGLSKENFNELMTCTYTVTAEKNEQSVDNSVIVTFLFVFDEEETVRKVLNALNDISLTYQPEENCTVTLLGSQVTKVLNEGLKEAQEEVANSRMSYLTAMEKAKTSMSSSDLLYYEQVVSGGAEKAVKKASTAFSPKWPVLSGILFLFAGLAFYIFRYVLTAKLNDEKELKYLYDLPVIAVLESEKKVSGLMKLILRAEDRFRMPASNLAYALSSMKLTSGGNELLIVDRTDAEASAVADRFGEACEELEISDLLSKSPEALEMALRKGSATLLIHMNQMYRSTLKRELDILKARNVQVNGAVILR